MLTDDEGGQQQPHVVQRPVEGGHDAEEGEQAALQRRHGPQRHAVRLHAHAALKPV